MVAKTWWQSCASRLPQMANHQVTAKELVILSCCNALSANEIYTRVVQDKTRLNSSHLWTRWKCTGKQYLQNYLFTWLPHKPKGCWDFGYSAHHCHRRERRHFIRQLHIIVTEERDVISFANLKDVFSRQTTLEFSLTITSFSMKEKQNFNRKKKLNGWIDFQSIYFKCICHSSGCSIIPSIP